MRAVSRLETEVIAGRQLASAAITLAATLLVVTGVMVVCQIIVIGHPSVRAIRDPEPVAAQAAA